MVTTRKISMNKQRGKLHHNNTNLFYFQNWGSFAINGGRQSIFWNLRRIQSQLTVITNIVFAQGLSEIPNLYQYGGFKFKPICAGIRLLRTKWKDSIIHFQSKIPKLKETGQVDQVVNEVNILPLRGYNHEFWSQDTWLLFYKNS